MRLQAISAVSLLALLLAPDFARATVVLPADFSELVSEARAIVHGRVIAVEGRWADGRRRIDSLVALEITQYLKGDLGRRLTIKVLGGAVGSYRSVIVGAPSFAVGDEVILFLGSRGPSWPYVLGLSQGMYRVVREPASGRTLVTPPVISARSGGVGRIVRGDPARRPLPIDEFARHIAEVLATLGEGAAGGRGR